MQDPEAAKYVAGLGIHWYRDFVQSPTLLTQSRQQLGEDRFIIGTEACNTIINQSAVILGSWSRGERYGKSILEDLNYGVAGWTDWNLALDEQGGPNWVENYVDAPVIVNATAQEFYKQPMFYVLGHFSRFISPGSHNVELIEKEIPENISYAAFITPENKTVILVQNRSNKDLPIKLFDQRFPNRQATMVVYNNSVVTLEYLSF